MTAYFTIISIDKINRNYVVFATPNFQPEATVKADFLQL